MMSREIKRFLFPMLLAAAGMLAACTDDPTGAELDDRAEEVYEGDVLKITVTLDNMGGAATRADLHPTVAELKRLESYVDPEKFRVLVFDDEDRFLFESKSRWIKQLDPSSDHSIWSVAIPLYTYGNDGSKDFDWRWSEIRTALTTASFKIAVLANRPEVDIMPEMSDNDISSQFDNSGPHWTVVNTVAGATDASQIKTVFDLHHSQYDPIYENKGNDSNWSENGYAFIMGTTEKGKPALSATSSWVDFSNDDAEGKYVKKNPNNAKEGYYLTEDEYEPGPGLGKNRDPRGWNFRKSRLPDETYPIPMYGIQQFEPLIGWKKGTTIDLNRSTDKPIALLRSVVKLELVVPKLATAKKGVEYPTDVVLFYSNIYARCEPMNVWTPTDRVWADATGRHDGVCDMDIIISNAQQGRITVSADYDDARSNNPSGSFTRYRQRIGWYYGAWWQADKWPQLNTYLSSYNKQTTKFPQVFNPCIQRNSSVYVEKTYEDADGYHYVVYTGERNVNDPSSLSNMGSDGSGSPTVLYWCVVYDTENNKNFWGDGEGAITYSFPVADYSGEFHNGVKANIYNVSREGRVTPTYSDNNNPSVSNMTGLKPANSERCAGGWSSGKESYGANGTGMGEYLRRVQGHKNYDCRTANEDAGAYPATDYPLPLVRNHVYTLTMTPASRAATDDDNGLSFSVQLEERHTKDIGFPIAD